MKEIEQEDELWKELERKKGKRRGVAGNTHTTTTNDEATNAGSAVQNGSEAVRSKAKSNAPRGFY
jgi:hypothetical protein